ncbi:hypothetical protein T484DRAFT_1799871 [Baffinella frigidus]|nr:hypothetical protein T484DRAFT_1799871 [Cryptophyta sp. CCMP2293]
MGFDQRTDWQPIESQRALLWAGRQGKAEQFMDRLNYRHFEKGEAASDRKTVLAAMSDAGMDMHEASAERKGESASDRKTVLAAMSDAGMDAEEATKFLDTKEMEDTNGRKTVLAAMSDAGMDDEEATKFLDTKEMEETIHAIPFFVFSAPELGVSGGPLRWASREGPSGNP